MSGGIGRQTRLLQPCNMAFWSYLAAQQYLKSHWNQWIRFWGRKSSLTSRTKVRSSCWDNRTHISHISTILRGCELNAQVLDNLDSILKLIFLVHINKITKMINYWSKLMKDNQQTINQLGRIWDLSISETNFVGNLPLWCNSSESRPPKRSFSATNFSNINRTNSPMYIPLIIFSKLMRYEKCIRRRHSNYNGWLTFAFRDWLSFCQFLCQQTCGWSPDSRYPRKPPTQCWW